MFDLWLKVLMAMFLLVINKYLKKVLLGPLQVWVRHREKFESFNKEVFVMMWEDWKRISRFCSEVGVEPKKLDGIFGVFCLEIIWSGRGLLWFLLWERCRGVDDSDEGIIYWFHDVVEFLFRRWRINCRLIVLFKNWFLLECLVLLRSWSNEGYVLCFASYCGSFIDAWGMAGISVHIMINVFLQSCSDFLHMKYDKMIGVVLFDLM